jgi:hypothetical protein
MSSLAADACFFVGEEPSACCLHGLWPLRCLLHAISSQRGVYKGGGDSGVFVYGLFQASFFSSLQSFKTFVSKKVSKKFTKNFAHIFSACSSFLFLPYASAVIKLFVCAGM